MTNEKLNILVVEDKPIHQESARILLGNEYDLKIAERYSDAINYLNQEKFDALLTDMMFPLGEGLTQDKFSEAPLGYALALYATRPKIAVPRIAILTDLNHHSNAVSATFDSFHSQRKEDEPSKELAVIEEHCMGNSPENSYYQGRPVFQINQSYLALFDERDLTCCGITSDKRILFDDDFQMSGGLAKRTKNWKECLEIILSIGGMEIK